MSYIISFFDWITSAIQNIWDFFLNFLESFLHLFEYLGVTVDSAMNLVGALPAWLLPFGSFTITISVLYIILGRQTGGKKGP